MPNNWCEGIKLFIVCVCVLALNTMVTLQLRSCLHLPASSQTPAGSWQSPHGLIVCRSSQGAEPRLLLQPSPAARSSSSLGEIKMPSLPERCWAQVQMDAAPVTVSALSARGSLTKSDRFHSKFSMPQSLNLWFWYITEVFISKAK